MAKEINYDDMVLRLCDCFHGVGQKEKILVSNLALVTNEQIRSKILPKFNDKFGKQLLGQIQAETQGELRKLLTLLLESRYKNWTTLIEWACKNSKRYPQLITRVLSLVDQQDRFKIVQAFNSKNEQASNALGQAGARQIRTTDSDAYMRIFGDVKDEYMLMYVRAIMMNDEQITEMGVQQFVLDCKDKIPAFRVFRYLVTMDTPMFRKFSALFKEDMKLDFLVFIQRFHGSIFELVKVHVTALENPVLQVAEILRFCVENNEQQVLMLTTAIFRDYHNVNIDVIYKQKYGSLATAVRQNQWNSYRDALLRFWGVIWF